MKNLFNLLVTVVLGLSVVSCYDDSDIRGILNKHEESIAILDSLCSGMNGDINALKTLVSAVQNSDYITDVAPLIEDGKEIGYVVTFAKHGSVTIYYGSDGLNGTDGLAPIINVKQDEDGEYYWTINGEWLIDGDGAKVKVVGADGKDGNTPSLKIEDDYWHVSYDNGKTWNKLDKAAYGNDSVDSIFQKVYQQGEYVYFVLSNGTTYKVYAEAVAHEEQALDIIFDVPQGVKMVPDVPYIVNYQIVGSKGNTTVRTLIDGTQYMRVSLKQKSQTTGYLLIIIDDCFHSVDDPDRDTPYYSDLPDISEEEEYHSTLSVFVSVADENDNIVKALNINEGKISSVQDTYIVDPEGGELTVKVKANLDYKVSIPEECDWLTLVPEVKSDLRTDVVVFSVDNLNQSDRREAEINLVNDDGLILWSFVIAQFYEMCAECNQYPCRCCTECHKYPCKCCPECGQYLSCECYKNLITIDGDFSDWDALEPALMSVATCAPDPNWTALRTLKVYADEIFIHVYFEFAGDEIVDRESVPVHIYINEDNNTEDCGDYLWLGQGGQDYILEGFVFNSGDFCSYDPGFFAYDGTDLTIVTWTWQEILPYDSGIATGAGSGNKYEISILTEMMPGLELARTFGLGITILKEWDEIGVLPNTLISDDNPEGAAPMLQVRINRRVDTK